MIGRIHVRSLLAVVLMLVGFVPGPALGQSSGEKSSGDDYEYADDSEDTNDYAVDGSDVDEIDADATTAAAEPGENRWQRAGEMSLDLLFLRPVAVGAAVVGFGFFMVSAPFMVFTGQIETTRDLYMGVPGEYAFQRAVGDI